MKWRPGLSYTILFLATLIFGVLLCIRWVSINRIKNDPVIINGAILKKLGRVNKTRTIYVSDFMFYVNDRKVNVVDQLSIKIKIPIPNLINKHFPVIYEHKNPENAYILITKEGFERFNIPYPDSLLWLYMPPKE